MIMRTTSQGSAQQAAEQAARSAEAAGRAAELRALEAQEAAQQTQLRIQEQVQQAIEAAGRSGRMSAAERDQLRDQIRTAIEASRDAARDAALEHSTGVGFPDHGPPGPIIPPEVIPITSIMGITLVSCVVGFPIARAIGRWIDRRSATPPAASQDVVNRLAAIEQAVESVAVEVERISEGQRFTTRVLSERTHEAAPEFVAARDALPVNARRS
jgi:multidrug efflux pump subunit AcrA (membrane-fusion protein)